MSKLFIAPAAVALALALGGCALVDQIRMSAAEYAGNAILLECGLALNERRANLSAVNGWLAMENHTSRAIALDCDGDGAPDF